MDAAAVGTVIGASWWIGAALSLIGLIHALTRPQRAWIAADRNKGYWVGSLAIGILVGWAGFISAIAYLVGAVPGMSRAVTDRRFDKGYSAIPSYTPASAVPAAVAAPLASAQASASTCPQCGTPSTGDRFCTTCGAPLSPGGPT